RLSSAMMITFTNDHAITNNYATDVRVWSRRINAASS
ncbi:hypothetical protein D030_4028B, partial [Vibrio parahaemolyticus AQ3810]